MSSTNIQEYSDQQLSFVSANGDRKITFGSATGTTEGVEIEYDRLTTPKIFKISPLGVNWNDGVDNYNTGLARLAVVQQAFQAVELPPNATTLKLNDTLLLSDGTNTNTINDTSIAFTNSTAEVVGSYSGNSFALLTDASASSVGTAGINAVATNSSGTLISSLGGGVVGMPSPPYPAPDANWSLSVQSGSFNPALYLSKSAPFTNSTSMTLDLNNLTHFQSTGSPSPDNDFTISTNKDLLMTSSNFNVSSSQISSTSSGLGGLADPQLLLTNSNATINTIPTIEFNKTGRNLTAGESVGSISMYGLDASGQKTEWSRIQVKTENVATGNEDGTLSIFNSVNGSSLEVFNFNGGQNENNTFRPLDMNGNALRSNTGNLVFETLSSVGTGAINMNMKTGGFVNIPSAVVGSNNYVRITPNSSTNANRLELSNTETGTNFRNSINLLNSQYAPEIELKADFSTGGANNKSINIVADGNTAFNKITAYDGQANNPFQIISTNPTSSGSLEIVCDNTAGDLIFTGTNLESGTAGGNSGQHLRIKLNGTYYKIKLEND
jgi:hypothetical protein